MVVWDERTCGWRALLLGASTDDDPLPWALDATVDTEKRLELAGGDMEIVGDSGSGSGGAASLADSTGKGAWDVQPRDGEAWIAFDPSTYTAPLLPCATATRTDRQFYSETCRVSAFRRSGKHIQSVRSETAIRAL